METVLPPVHDQAVVVSDPETVTFEPAPHLSHERQLSMTSAMGEKMMSTLPPAIGIVPSAVPWIARTDTGAARVHGTSALPLAVAMLPDTGATAATTPENAHARR